MRTSQTCSQQRADTLRGLDRLLSLRGGAAGPCAHFLRQLGGQVFPGSRVSFCQRGKAGPARPPRAREVGVWAKRPLWERCRCPCAQLGPSRYPARCFLKATPVGTFLRPRPARRARQRVPAAATVRPERSRPGCDSSCCWNLPSARAPQGTAATCSRPPRPHPGCLVTTSVFLTCQQLTDTG